jgi:GNAT superfamily N-acetyltransferase
MTGVVAVDHPSVGTCEVVESREEVFGGVVCPSVPVEDRVHLQERGVEALGETTGHRRLSRTTVPYHDDAIHLGHTIGTMVAGQISLDPMTSLPDDIAALLGASLAEGHNLVKRLVDEWNDGSNRFDLPGEIALEARLGRKLVGVGGLNRDPYLDDPAAGRIRHLYVLPEARRRGVGRSLVLALIAQARPTFSRVRLRTSQPDASLLYMALGFEETGDEPDATHVFRL